MVGVNPCGRHDVDLGLLRDLANARDVAPQPDDGEIDDGVNAFGLELIQPGDCVGDAMVFLAPFFRVIQEDLCIQHKDMLVHQSGTELRGVDGAANSLHLSHAHCPEDEVVSRCETIPSGFAVVKEKQPGLSDST
jgi:hypothetical protein